MARVRESWAEGNETRLTEQQRSHLETQSQEGRGLAQAHGKGP